jgi:hypothetical protein
VSRILQVFFDADMRCGHEGLELLAKKHKIDLKKLDPGNFVVFVNSAKDRLKIYTAYNVIAYMKSPAGKIDMRAVQFIPKAFEAKGTLTYDEALKELFEKQLPIMKDRFYDK